MHETVNNALPLVQAAQAQKHVTVNEALARLDALVQIRLAGVGANVPPGVVADGEAWGIGAAPVGEWAGQAGRLAIGANSAWVFADARPGWRGWDEGSDRPVLFDGQDWRADGVAASGGGAVTVLQVIEMDHAVGAGASSQTADIIPANAVVLGISGRVLEAIATTGAASYALGIAGAVDRYGAGLGLGQGSYALGLSGQPQCYYDPTPLVLTPDAGMFDGGGVVRLAVHCLSIEPPRAV